MSKRLKMIKTCPNCGEDFHPYNKKQFCCSRKCLGQSKPVTLVCTNCKKEYKKPYALSQRIKHNNFCSVQCKSDYGSSYVNCKYCEKKFKIIKSWILEDGNYCSKDCANKGMEVEKVKLICDFCSNEFERYPSEVQKNSDRGYRFVFCSHKCRAAMIANQFEKPTPYLGMHTSPPRNTSKIREWRKLVFENDNYTCQDCGETDLMLCAHHIKPYALYPKLRYEPTNGVTLCYQCHEKRHSLS